MAWTWVEPFAGAAACALRLVGGRDLAPPVAWMGGKRRLAGAILGAMGVPEGRPGRVVLCDAGPWGWVWPLLLSEKWAPEVAYYLRVWSNEHPRALWERLAACPPAEDKFARAGQWLWLQARSASGVPIWWDGWRLAAYGRGAPQSVWKRYGDDNAGRWRVGKTEGRSTTQKAWQKDGAWLASDGRGEPRPAGARAVGGRWEKGHPCGRGAQDASNGQRGAGTTTGGRTGGMVNPGTIAARILSIAESFRGVERDVRHVDAAELEPVPGAWVYLDPPYQGSTGYGWDCPREQVMDLARRWADAGAVVAVSEAVPLELPGWHHLELTKPGGKPEWLTLSRPAARVPDRQLALFEGHP